MAEAHRRQQALGCAAVTPARHRTCSSAVNLKPWPSVAFFMAGDSSSGAAHVRGGQGGRQEFKSGGWLQQLSRRGVQQVPGSEQAGHQHQHQADWSVVALMQHSQPEMRSPTQPSWGTRFVSSARRKTALQVTASCAARCDTGSTQGERVVGRGARSSCSCSNGEVAALQPSHACVRRAPTHLRAVHAGGAQVQAAQLDARVAIFGL